MSNGQDKEQRPNEAPFVSGSCAGERCAIHGCGKPAAAKVGEEIMHDDPNPNRHNLTAYVCAAHFWAIVGHGERPGVDLDKASADPRVVAIIRALGECDTCKGTGIDDDCPYCGDSTYDHYCPPGEPCSSCDQTGLKKEARDALAILRAGPATDYPSAKVPCVDCGEPEDVEAVYCRKCERANGQAERQVARREALLACLTIAREVGHNDGIDDEASAIQNGILALLKVKEPCTDSAKGVDASTAVHHAEREEPKT